MRFYWSIFYSKYSFVEYCLESITILDVVRTGEQVLYCHDCSIPFLLVITVNEHWTRD